MKGGGEVAVGEPVLFPPLKHGFPSLFAFELRQKSTLCMALKRSQMVRLDDERMGDEMMGNKWP